MNGNDVKDRLAAINEQIHEANRVAQAKWAAFDQARKSIEGKHATDASVRASESVHSEYVAAAAELKRLQGVRDRIFAEVAAAPAAVLGDPLGDRAAKSAAYKSLVDSGVLNSDRQSFQVKLADLSAVETKTLITGLSDTSGGAFVSADRGAYGPLPKRAPSVLDLVTVAETKSDSIEYARQAAWTNVAAEVAEATTTATGTKPEAAIPFEKVTELVRTIAHWVPATRRSLADGGQLASIINEQLVHGVRLRLEDQIVAGDGAGENLTGIINTSGILTQPKGADSVADAIHKAITQLRLGHVEPTGIVLHPNDWQLLRLARDDGGSIAGTGSYLFGAPGEASTPMVWGVPVAVTTAITDDTVLVGDFRQSTLWVREGVQVLASDSHDDFFTKNLVALLAEGRFAFGVLQPASFCKVTSVD